MTEQKQQTGDEGPATDWYVLGAHTRRAIGYLGAKLAEDGALADDFEQPRLLELWAEALGATMDGDELSPIGADAAAPGPPLPDDPESELRALAARTNVDLVALGEKVKAELAAQEFPAQRCDCAWDVQGKVVRCALAHGHEEAHVGPGGEVPAV